MPDRSFRPLAARFPLGSRPAVALTVVGLALLGLARGADAFQWPWEGSPWPTSSTHPVTILDHPTVESVLADLAAVQGSDAPESYRFVAYGDQRALADGEWQEMIARIEEMDRRGDHVAFVVDTGDIVDDGRHADQFHMLRGILKPIDHIPYLVGIGNHELDNNRSDAARAYTARFLRRASRRIAPNRLWYRKDLGEATFLFLDTNDWVYGPNGDRKTCPKRFRPESREAKQVEWLREHFRDLDAEPGIGDLRIAVMHHPFVQSSEKHRKTARSLWNLEIDGRALVDFLADGGIDVVLTGHTHTYERFRLVRRDGREIAVVNVSGRPRDAVLWIGSGSRRARDIRGEEAEFFEDEGWRHLDHWTIVQEDLMEKDDETNQFAVFTVEQGGILYLEPCFLDEDSPDGIRRGDRVRLH